MAYQTHPLVNAPPPFRIANAKQTCHGPARYKIEWIYTRTKASGPDSLELALILNEKERKKERKNEKWAIFQISGSGMYNCFDE